MECLFFKKRCQDLRPFILFPVIASLAFDDNAICVQQVAAIRAIKGETVLAECNRHARVPFRLGGPFLRWPATPRGSVAGRPAIVLLRHDRRLGDDKTTINTFLEHLPAFIAIHAHGGGFSTNRAKSQGV